MSLSLLIELQILPPYNQVLIEKIIKNVTIHVKMKFHKTKNNAINNQTSQNSRSTTEFRSLLIKSNFIGALDSY